MKANIHGHGPLGDLYPDYDGGDIWSSKLGQVRGIKEGDTPSFLSLVPNGLGDVDIPGWAVGAGGSRAKGDRLTDVADTDLDTSGDPDPRMSSVYRWRPAFQADFAARLDWCMKPYAGANHPPDRPDRGGPGADGQGRRYGGPRRRAARPTRTATGWISPGASTRRPPSFPARSSSRAGTRGTARLVIAPELAGRTIPILLTVTDRGRPRLTRYGRVLITVRGDGGRPEAK